MARVEIATPKVVFDLYQSLTEDQKMVFLAHLASISNGKHITCLIESMPTLTKTELNQRIYGHIIDSMLPVLTGIAFDLVAKTPEIQREDARIQMANESQRYLKGIIEEAAVVERAIVKDQRDRKSDPETVKRNVEICDLRLSDPKKWSHRRLAREFKVTPQYIGLVLKEEAEWRRRVGDK